MSAAPVIWTYTKTHIAARLKDFITLGAYMRFRPPLCTYRLNWAMGTSWRWRNEWDDTWFEIRTPAVCGRVRYTSVTKAPHNIKSFERGRNIFFLKPECQSGVRTRDLRFSRQATCFNHSTGPPPQSLAPVAVLVGSYSCSICFCSAWYQVYR